MTDAPLLPLPEHVVQLRRLVRQADNGVRHVPAWMLAQALASFVVSANQARPDLVSLAAEGLSALAEVDRAGTESAPADAREIVGAVLRWRAAVAGRDPAEAESARGRLGGLLAEPLPSQVRGLVEEVRAKLLAPPLVPPGSAEQRTLLEGGQDAPFDMVALQERLEGFRAQAHAVPESDPRRARWLAVGALGPVVRALGRGVWSEHEDRLIDEARAAVEKPVEGAGPDDGLLGRAIVLTLRGARCLAAWVGTAPGRPGEVEALCAEIDRFVDAAWPA